MKIVIIGAGVAGLSAAIALRLKGFAVEVYERGSAGRHPGAGIVCWPNASFVLDQFGMLEQIAAVSGRPVAMRRLDHAGERLGALDLTQLDKLMGYPSFSILRRDLMALLESRAAELGVSVHYRAGAKAFLSLEPGQAAVMLEDGRELTADLIIAADGRMASAGRDFVQGDCQARFQGAINWVGVFESSGTPFDEMAISDYWGLGERFGIVPVSANKAYWAGAVAAPVVGRCEPARYKAELLDLFAGWPEPIPEIIGNTPLESIHKIYLHDHDPIECWHRDNVLLIGDAAHAPLPTSGQGACQALEDGWHLANLMEGAGDGLSRILSKFTERRAAKTAGITSGARALAASLFNTDADHCRERNLHSRSINYAQMVRGMARGWSSGLPLADMSI